MALTLNLPNIAPLFDLAEEYHYRTEKYDRMVCTGEIRYGGIMPRTDHERTLINKNAIKVREEMCRRAWEMGFEQKYILAAIKQVGVTYEYREENEYTSNI